MYVENGDSPVVHFTVANSGRHLPGQFAQELVAVIMGDLESRKINYSMYSSQLPYTVDASACYTSGHKRLGIKRVGPEVENVSPHEFVFFIDTAIRNWARENNFSVREGNPHLTPAPGSKPGNDAPA